MLLDMKRFKQYVGLLSILLLVIANETNGQEINGDTIYVDSKTVVALRFPSLPSNFYTNPPDAPYNFISLPTGFTVIARKKNTALATLTVIENKRTHNFILTYKKPNANGTPMVTDYDFSSTKKLKERVKQLEEREKKYGELVKTADKYFQDEDFENAKIAYNDALNLLNKPWPQEQLVKIKKLLKKKKRKKN
jgi:hypothetical protein